MDACTTGARSTAIGVDALGGVTTGTSNVGVGYRAGQTGTALTTGTNNIYVGHNSAASASSVVGEIVVGSTVGDNTTGKGGNTGFINPNGGGVYNGGNTTTWTTTSDQRIKKNIVDNNEGIDIINQIRVRNFEYRLPEEIDGGLKPTDAVKKSGVQLGVIAQELAEICPDCVTTESTGVMSVNTDELFWHMVNAIKQLKSEIDSLKSQINGA